MTRVIYSIKAFALRERIADLSTYDENFNEVSIEIVKAEKETEKAIYVWVFTNELDIIKFWLPKSTIVRAFEITEDGEKDIEIKAERATVKTTKSNSFTDIEEAQKAIDEAKATGTFVMFRIEKDRTFTVITK